MFKNPIGYRIRTLSNLMKKGIDCYFDTQHLGNKHSKATIMQAWIIGFVMLKNKHNEDTFQKDIEEEFTINRSTTSEMLKLMENKGMIERKAVGRDARLKKIVLTEKGIEFYQWVTDIMNNLNQQLLEGVSQQEQETMIVILDKLINNIKKSQLK